MDGRFKEAFDNYKWLVDHARSREEVKKVYDNACGYVRHRTYFEEIPAYAVNNFLILCGDYALTHIEEVLK